MRKTSFFKTLAMSSGMVLAFSLARPAFDQVSEYGVKAAYLFNFAKFVEWPAGISGGDASPILVGILGKDPFGDELDRAVEDKSVNGHSVRLKRFGVFDGTQAPQLQKCQILFIAYSEKAYLADILTTLEGAPVLTVSEIDRFTAKGGMILFDQEGQRITLGVNLKAAQKSKLGISAKLLQISKIYKSE